MSIQRTDILEPPSRVASLAEFDSGSITDSDGWSLGCDASRVELREGDVVEYWGTFGRPVRGLAVGFHVFWYRTEAEQAAHEAEQNRRRDEERRADFQAHEAEHDARYESLPDTFKARIDRFRRGNPDFRWQFEPYEMLCCVDAVKIASYCSINRIAAEHEGDEPTAAENVQAFTKLPWEEQAKAGVDDGHSGNTFGVAVRLAHLWVTEPGMVEYAHGAMTPLVGCVTYGCTHETADAGR